MAAAPPYVTGPDCADKVHQPGAGPCAADNSTAYWPGWAFWHPQDCDHDDPYHNGYEHLVCGACLNNIHSQPWAQQGHQDVHDPGFLGNASYSPPSVWPWPGGNAGTGFLTRLCRACEHVEQCKFGIYLNVPLDRHWRAMRPNISVRQQMVDWPRNTCTCKWHLGEVVNPPPNNNPSGGRLCIRHRKLQWDRIVAERDNNDEWLRTLATDSNRDFCVASGHRIRSRRSAKSKSYRACRCGADVDTPPHPSAPGQPPGGAEVWLCMGCSGLVHVVDPGTPASIYQGPFGGRHYSDKIFETKNRACKKSRARGDMTLGRERKAHRA